MKQFLLTTLTIITTVIAYSQNKPLDCSFFKTGDLAYRDSTTNSVWKIKRTRKVQTETNEQTGAVIKNKIEWISACEYKLTQTWTNKQEFKNRNHSWRIYQIISVNDNIYTYRCNCNDGTKIEGTVVKMRY